MYVRTAPHEGRTFGLGRLWRGTIHGDPMAAFRGNYAQRDVMQQVRQKLRKFRDFRILVRNIPGFNIGGGSFDIDFVLRGPDLESSSPSTPRSSGRAPSRWAASPTPTPRSASIARSCA